MKAIFFIGPDGCGKTEISRAVANELRIPRFKASSERKNWLDQTFVNSLSFDLGLPDFVAQTRTDFVSDRGYPCEWVYSQVYKRPTDFRALEVIDEFWARLGAVHIICLRNSYVNARPDEFVTNDKLQTIHEKYLEFAKWTRCDTYTLYVDDTCYACVDGTPDLNAQVDNIETALRAFRLKHDDPEVFRMIINRFGGRK